MDDAGLQGSDEYPFALLDWLETGDLEARALSTKVGAGHHTNAPVPKQVWAKARTTMGGIDFHGEGAAKAEIVVGRDEDNAGELVTITARGISVRADQLAQLAPAAASSPCGNGPTSEGSRRPSGAPPKIADWHDAWFAAMKLLDEGELEQFQSQKALRGFLAAKIGDRLSEESLKPIVHRIWFAFKDRG